jgi:hypothetical protein
MIISMAWIGIIVAAVIDFFNASDKMGKGVDLAADISWAVMNLLIAAYAFLYYRSRWGGFGVLCRIQHGGRDVYWQDGDGAEPRCHGYAPVLAV